MVFGRGKGLRWEQGWKDGWFADDGHGGIYSIDQVSPDEWAVNHLSGPVDAREQRPVAWPDQRRGLKAAKRACQLDLESLQG